MMTNVLAVKSGDIAAQVAAEAIARGDTSESGLKEYERHMRKLNMYTSGSWLHNLLIRAPLELPPARLNALFDKLTLLELGKVMEGRVWPIISFFLRRMPTLLLDAELRRYLVP